jgi:hypothetical protein
MSSRTPSAFVIVASLAALVACAPEQEEIEGDDSSEALSDPKTVDDAPCSLTSRFLDEAEIDAGHRRTAQRVFEEEGVPAGDGLAGFDRLSAKGKQEVLWQLHSAFAGTDGKYRPTSTTNLREAALALPNLLSKSFTRTCDVFPEPKTKLVHTYGAVAKVRLEITNPQSGYTGIFATGGPAIARISLAEPLDNVVSGFIPGLGLKFLVQGAPSENIIVMRNLTAQVDAAGAPDHRIFKEWWANEFEAPSSLKMKLVKHVFENALKLLAARGAQHESPFYRGLFGLASVGQRSPSDVRTPRDIVLKPVVANTQATSGSTTIDFRDKLAALKEGDVLFEVVAKGSYRQGQFFEGRNPRASGDEEVPIGRLVLESNFTASSFGDRMLFFKHRL